MKYPAFLKNKTFAIPYNNDPKLIDELHKLLPEPKPFALYIYFAPNPLIAMAGRKFPSQERYLDAQRKFNDEYFNKELIETLKKAKKYNFKTNLLLNNVLLGLPHFNEDLKTQIPIIQNYLEKIYSYGCLDRVTIGNPYLLELINWTRIPEVEIKTSVNLQIKSSKSVDLLNNISDTWLRKNIAAVEIQKDLLREPKELAEIRKKIKPDTKLSILVNEGCLLGCPYQMAHQLHSFSFPAKNFENEGEKFNFGVAKCKYITNQEPWRILDANWILPVQLKKLSKFVDEFKITDRHASTENIVNMVRAYVFGVYNKDNINELISMLSMEKFNFPERLLPVDFFEKVMAEKKPLDSYYKNIWKKIERYNKLNNIGT